MIAGMVTTARLLPVRWWLAYGAYAVAMIAVALIWDPHMLVVGIMLVIGSLPVRLFTPVRPPVRHHRKQLGTEHLAE